MKSLVVAMFLLALVPVNALAATALALGCGPTGQWAFGYGSNYPNEESAAQEALRRCNALATHCKVMRVMSGGGFLALAFEPDQPCGTGPAGYAYEESKQGAVSHALQSCHEVHGTQCKIVGGWNDAGEGGYGIPSNGNPGWLPTPIPSRPETHCYTIHNERVQCQ